MSIFASQTELKPETVGGSRLFETGIYSMVVDMAYLDESKGGAYSLNVVLKAADGKTHKETLWITGGRDKGQLTYFLNKSNEKQDLPGFAIANALAFHATGKDLGGLVPEEKMVNIYNYDLKKDVPTPRQVFMDMIGQQVKVAIVKQTVDKTKKNDATGKYEPTGETREENEISQIFNEKTDQSLYEAKNSLPAEIAAKWVAVNAGKTRNRSKAGKEGTTTGAPAGTDAPRKSLFA